MSNDLWAWGSDAAEPRILHSMIRVSNLNASLDFYCRSLGMKTIARHDVEAGRFSIVFLSFSDNFDSGALELTYNWDGPPGGEGYSHGTGYGHMAFGVPDVPALCKRLQGEGVEITVAPKILFPGGPSLAFIKDPDGYNIELIQTSKAAPGV